MDVVQEKTAEICSCPYCKSECKTEIRPYVCPCGAVFGKRGWLTTVTVNKAKNLSGGSHKNAKAESGRKAWSALHSIELGTPESFAEWKKHMPSGCECKKKADAILKRIPPCYESPKDWFEWTVLFHNEVNLSLGKPAVSLERAYFLWKHKRPDSGRKRAVITVANGLEFSRLLSITRPSMQAYADRVDADFIDLDNDTETWGPMEKFRVHHFAKQYDEVMFVDADCWITEKCPDLFSCFDGDVAIHDDFEMLKSPSVINEERNRVHHKSLVEIPQLDTAYNTGVVITKKSAANIWIRPEVPIGTSRFSEQVWIEGQINRNAFSVTKLPHEANWQYWYGKNKDSVVRFEDGVRDAWIIHAAANNKKQELLERVKSYISVPEKQPRINCLTAVTSLSFLPHHISVQDRCLKSWVDFGLRIVSGNSAQDIEKLQSIYPYVEFKECGQSVSYNRPTSRIYDLMRLESGPILLINSDIEVYGDQSLLVNAVKSGKSIIGLRHNYGSSIFEADLEKWGMDAFLLYPEQIATFPDVDFAIGQPMWDYWIPCHLESINAPLQWVGDPFFFHKSHQVHWNKVSLEIGRAMIKNMYGIENSQSSWENWRSHRPYGVNSKHLSTKVD